MNCIFMGTPLFGKYILERLVKIVNIKLVLYQPDEATQEESKKLNLVKLKNIPLKTI